MFESASTSEIVARAIDVCALKQAVYSANIANANVDGYRRMEVIVDSQIAQTERTERSLIRPAVVDPAPASAATVVTTDAAVKLDEEMAALARNALRYQTLLGIYERSSGLLKMAIHEGRGG